MIPKKIFQTWYTKNLPQNVQDSIQKMLNNNSGYEYFLFDDDDMRNYISDNFDSIIFYIGRA